MSDEAARQAWSRTGSLFHRALERPSRDRRAFVEAEAGDDPALAADVLSLLAAHDRTDDFIEPAGHRVGPYTIERVLGAGGAGVVYLAEDTRLGRRVALKAVRPDQAGDPIRVERLQREARAAASLRHPGIATVYALEEIEGTWYLVSEYVPGDSLRDALDAGPLGVEQAASIGLAIARALASAHAGGVIHRDLKPDNIVWYSDQQVRILDFGLAHLIDADRSAPRLTADGTVLGTPAYMAPEQIRAEPVDGRTDLYGLGVVMFELATGQLPFRGESTAATLACVIENDPPPLTDHVPAADRGLPATAALNRIVLRCLAKAPRDRYASVAELIVDLDRALAGQTPNWPATVPVATRPAIWWWQFHQAVTTIVYVLLLVPLWRARQATADEAGTWLYLAGVLVVIAAGALRLHLWFTSRHHPGDWATQHVLSRRWIRAADAVWAVVLVTSGVRAIRLDEPAVLLVAAGAAVVVSAFVIEPATTRAAFGGSRPGQRLQ